MGSFRKNLLMASLTIRHTMSVVTGEKERKRSAVEMSRTDGAGAPSVADQSSLFIHSGYFYRASSSSLLLTGASRRSTHAVPKFHAEAQQATVSEGLAQVHYIAARAGVEPMSLRTKGAD